MILALLIYFAVLSPACRSATPVASGFGPTLRLAAWMVYYTD
jgi:hypothetical protein